MCFRLIPELLKVAGLAKILDGEETGRVKITFNGYEDNPRELHEIEEVLHLNLIY